MAAERYKVIVLAGTERPEFIRNVGWFSTTQAAEAWCEGEGLGHTPVAGEWVVVPRRDEDVQPLVNEAGC